MGKEDKKVYKDRSLYVNTQQTESYRQQLAKEKKILAAKTKADIERLHPYFEKNNNYFGLMKKDPESGNKDAIKFEHPLEQLGQVENNFYQKSTRDKNFYVFQDQDRLEKRKTELQFPLTSNQAYGWRPPIDDTVGKTGYGLKSTIQSYNTSFRSEPKKKQN